MTSKAKLEAQVSHTAGRLWDLFKDAEERIAKEREEKEELARRALAFMDAVSDEISDTTFEMDGWLSNTHAKLSVMARGILKTQEAKMNGDMEGRMQSQIEGAQNDYKAMYQRIQELELVVGRMQAANESVGAWLSAAQGDPGTCVSMREDINKWLDCQLEIGQVTDKNNFFHGISYGKTRIDNAYTYLAYILATRLERYPASNLATKCSSTAFDLLHLVGELAYLKEQPVPVDENQENCRCDSCLRGVTKATKSDADLGKCSMCDHPHMCPFCD